MPSPGRRKVAALGRLDHLRHFGGHFVRRHRDDAASADGHQRHRNRVVARQDDEVRGNAAADFGHLRDVAGGFLDADDIWNRREARERAGSTLHPVRPGTL
jgi:hypothetical protein